MDAKMNPERALAVFVSLIDAQEQLLKADLGSLSRDDLRELYDLLWDMPDDRPTLAQSLLPILINHPIPEIKSGALCGLIRIGIARDYLPSYREAAHSEEIRLRDAAAWGLAFSTEEADERLLWQLLDDPMIKVQFSAGYSLRDMAREIDSRKYFVALESHEIFRVRLILAERALRDKRLFARTRASLQRFWKTYEDSDVIDECNRDLAEKFKLPVD